MARRARDADGIGAGRRADRARASSTSTRTSASPATRTRRRSRPGVAAAAHGGFTTVCVMPNTTPAIDEPGDRGAGPGRGRRVGVAGPGARPRRGHRRPRRARRWRRSGELADAGVVGFQRRRVAGPRAPRSCATRSRTRARSGCRSSTTPRTRRSPRAPRRPRATSRTVLGLKGWPASAEAGAVARAIAILADVVRDVPGARLHLTHVSTARVARPRPGREGRRACR